MIKDKLLVNLILDEVVTIDRNSYYCNYDHDDFQTGQVVIDLISNSFEYGFPINDNFYSENIISYNRKDAIIKEFGVYYIVEIVCNNTYGSFLKSIRVDKKNVIKKYRECNLRAILQT